MTVEGPQVSGKVFRFLSAMHPALSNDIFYIVPEKCTECVGFYDHEACQAVCPTEAIVFGDLSDPESDVLREHGKKRAYALLGELNSKPRTVYLARITNPNPELAGA